VAVVERQFAFSIQDQELFATMKPVVDATGQAVGAVVVAATQESLDRRLMSFVSKVLGVGGLFIVLGLAILYWMLTRYVIQPLLDVIGAVNSLRQHDEEAPEFIQVDAADEAKPWLIPSISCWRRKPCSGKSCVWRKSRPRPPAGPRVLSWPI
jgi:hypothetical protein